MRLLSVSVALALAVGCSRPTRVDVRCGAAGTRLAEGFTCQVSHVDGADVADACWTLELACPRGRAIRGRACARVRPGESIGVAVPHRMLGGDLATCEAVESTRVVGLDIRRAQGDAPVVYPTAQASAR